MLKTFLKNFAVILLSLSLVSNCWGGIDFDAADDEVSLGSPTTLDDVTPITISAWMYNQGAGENSYGYIFAKTPSASTQGLRFFTDDSGTNTNRLAFGSHSTGGGGGSFPYRTTGDNVFTESVWTHVLVTWDGGLSGANIHIYVDGTDVSAAGSSDGVTAIASDASNTARVGNRTATDRTFNGVITEVAVWKHVLSAAQIAQLSGNRATVSNSVPVKGLPLQLLDPDADGTNELVLYLPMDEVTDGASADLATLFDWSGNANNGNPDNGSNNTGMTGTAEIVLNYPSPILGQQ